MKLHSIRNRIGFPALLLAFGFASVAGARAQQESPGPSSPPSLRHPGDQQQQTNPSAPGQSQQTVPAAPGGQPEVPKVNPQEEADYKALFDTKDPGMKIQLGQDFLQKYPTSRYTQGVYEQLVKAYSAKADWNDFYAVARKALANDPDDADVLVFVGWVIPHIYDQKDPNANDKLNAAEIYEKHALEIIPKVTNNGTMTDDQFAALKAGLLSEAHSALGMIDFRRGNNGDCVKELQQAIQGAASPDPTDLYVMGLALEQLKSFPEAADSLGKCSLIPGALEDRCKQAADRVHSETPQPK
jgi:tetratricopeptide (TPR) repeat protein